MKNSIQHHLTNEQQEVVEAVSRSKRLKVYALAGTGKTSTLKAIAARYPHRRMLYLAFNRAIADESKGKFPPNVEVRTVHSLAYKHLGNLYRGRLSRPDYFAIAEALDLPVKSVFEQMSRFQTFLNSGCPLDRSEITALVGGLGGSRDPDSTADFILRLFHALKHGGLKVDHSFYLKDFQLNFASCGLAGAYDAVLLDEGQDVNPVILSIFEQFRGRKIMVGDRHQKIYGFRGAGNAIEEFAAEETLYLTRTFRFHGQEQVKAVNDLLFHLKCEDNLLRPVQTDPKEGQPTGCIITRSNARLLEILLENPNLKPVRHPKQYFERFFSVFGRKIRVPEVPDAGKRSFTEYLRELDTMAETVGDQDLSACVKLIKRYGCDRLIFQHLYDKALKNYQNGCTVLLGTAHSTKGLEFDRVRLADDFKSPADVLERLLNDNPELCRGLAPGLQGSVVIRRSQLREVFAELKDDLQREEINLLYVAMTRAKQKIEIPQKYLISGEYVIEAPEERKTGVSRQATARQLF